MLIKSLEQKTRLALTTVLVVVASCVIICVTTILSAYSMISQERNQVYILDGDIPFLAERAELEKNFVMEAKSHIQQFHHYFFSLPPDNNYIDWTISKALYMADGSALKQKRAMQEKGFYADLVSSSAVCMIRCDSIQLDEHTKNFTFFGTQQIKRSSNSQTRKLVTSGSLQTVPRSRNNPHGLMITNWKTIDNTEIK